MTHEQRRVFLLARKALADPEFVERAARHAASCVDPAKGGRMLVRLDFRPHGQDVFRQTQVLEPLSNDPVSPRERLELDATVDG